MDLRKKIIFVSILSLIFKIPFAQNVNVSSITDCFGSIFNVTYSGSLGQFDDYSTPQLTLDHGIILSTGDAGGLLGNFTNGPIGGASDQDLLQVANLVPALIGQNFSVNSINDAAIIEFDFIPNDDTLNFGFVFASNEYPNFVNTAYNDAFGLFLSGPGINGPYTNNAINLGVVPNSDPSSSNHC